jgi:hypothetical protein
MKLFFFSFFFWGTFLACLDPDPGLLTHLNPITTRLLIRDTGSRFQAFVVGKCHLCTGLQPLEVTLRSRVGMMEYNSLPLQLSVKTLTTSFQLMRPELPTCPLPQSNLILTEILT